MFVVVVENDSDIRDAIYVPHHSLLTTGAKDCAENVTLLFYGSLQNRMFSCFCNTFSFINSTRNNLNECKTTKETTDLAYPDIENKPDDQPATLLLYEETEVWNRGSFTAVTASHIQKHSKNIAVAKDIRWEQCCNHHCVTCMKAIYSQHNHHNIHTCSQCQCINVVRRSTYNIESIERNESKTVKVSTLFFCDKCINNTNIILHHTPFNTADDAHFVSCFIHEIVRSRQYRKRVRNRLCWKYKHPHDSEKPTLYVVEMVLHYPQQKIDYSWNERIQPLLQRHVYLNENMAWLCTLGGGYSALGDHAIQHAEQAARISLVQLRLSLDLGDPIFASKCRVFFAQSLMQRGYLGVAKQIVRVQYEYGRRLGEGDEHLRAMCRGVWSRIQYLHHQRWLCRHSCSVK